MSNRRFEMYEYRQVIHRMRMGESDRAIARTKLAGRIKCGQIRAIAGEQGWLDKGLPLPDDEVLAAAFEEEKQQGDNPTHQSLSRSYEEQIRKWVEKKVCMRPRFTRPWRTSLGLQEVTLPFAVWCKG